MTKKFFKNLIEILKETYIGVVILILGVAILYILGYEKHTSYSLETNDILFLRSKPIPRVLLILLSLILVFLMIAIAINIIFSGFFKSFKK